MQTQLVLRSLLDDPAEAHYGLEIAERAGLKTGTLYPILLRLEKHGLVVASWEDIDPSEAGRPARKYYRLTNDGLATARFVLGESITRLGGSFNPGAIG